MIVLKWSVITIKSQHINNCLLLTYPAVCDGVITWFSFITLKLFFKAALLCLTQLKLCDWFLCVLFLAYVFIVSWFPAGLILWWVRVYCGCRADDLVAKMLRLLESWRLLSTVLGLCSLPEFSAHSVSLFFMARTTKNRWLSVSPFLLYSLVQNHTCIEMHCTEPNGRYSQ